MTFLAPALGALAAAVAVPLVLHLLQRHQGPRMIFPALRYLRRAEREHATRIRLRQILLLALRVLAILLVAAAAARPFLPLGGSAHVPMAVVIILDNSLSTGAVVGDHRVIDGLRDAALESVAAAGPDDRIWLIRAGEPWAPALTGDAAALVPVIRATSPSSGRADLQSAVGRAADLLESDGGTRPREIQLVSDLQESALESGAATNAAGAVMVSSPAAPPALHGARLRVLRPTVPPPANRGVGGVEVGGGAPPRAGQRSSVTATLTGSGTGDAVGVRLVVDSAVIAAGRAAPGESAVLAFGPREAGTVAGRVEIDADALVADDRRFFVADVRPPPRVAITRSRPFVNDALSVLEDADRIRRSEPAFADVVIAPAATGLDAVAAAAAIIVSPPASPVERPAANRRLADAGVPWRFGEPVPGEARLASGGTGLDRALADVRLEAPYPLEPVAHTPDTTLVRLEDGGPWAVAGTAATGRRFVLLGSPLTPDGGTLPTSAAMVPLLETALGAWAAGRPASVAYQPGDLVGVAGADSVRAPDGRVEAVGASTVYRLTGAGIYRTTHGDTTLAELAVNPPPSESDLARATRQDLLTAFGGGQAVDVVGPRMWSRAIYHRRLGREITLPLVAAAILLLLIETTVSASGGTGGGAGIRRGTRTGTASTVAAAGGSEEAPA